MTEEMPSSRYRKWCEDGAHDWKDAEDPLRQVCSACPTWQWKPGCRPRELHAQVLALSAKLTEVKAERDALKTVARRLVSRVDAIRCEAEAPRREFDLSWQLGCLINEIERAFSLRSSDLDAEPEASPREVVPACPQWQAIETAPKDGRWMLGWETDLGYFVWRDGPGLITGEDPAPTHWMPLPSPPAKGST